MPTIIAPRSESLLTSPERGDAINMFSASRSGLLSAEEDVKPLRGLLCDGSFWTAVLTISNAALGAGLLSVPYAFASAGIISGGLVTFLLIVACFASLSIIMALMARAQAADPLVISFGTLVEWGCGPVAAWGVELLVILNSFGACVGYVVLLGDVITPLVRT